MKTLLDITVPLFVFVVYIPTIILVTGILSIAHLTLRTLDKFSPSF